LATIGDKYRVRGLPSLAEARAERRRAIVGGRVRFRGMNPVFWLWTFLGMAIFGVVYWRIAVGKLEEQKNAVMAKQRAVQKSLGPKLLGFIERIEGFALELGADGHPDHLEPGVSWERVGREPGVYLRLALDESRSVAAIRKGAERSLNDGFTSCFFVKDPALSSPGQKCTRSAECPSGLLCNEYDTCSRPLRPFNLRLAYRAYRILSPEFSQTLREASDELMVRATDRDLDQVTRVDVPVAIEVLERSRLVTIVLDETPKEGIPKATVENPETLEQRLQRLPHDARIGIWDLVTGQRLVRYRGRAEGRLVALGPQRGRLEPDIVAAQERQGNSCALAMELRQALARRVDPGTGQSPAP